MYERMHQMVASLLRIVMQTKGLTLLQQQQQQQQQQQAEQIMDNVLTTVMHASLIDVLSIIRYKPLLVL